MSKLAGQYLSVTFAIMTICWGICLLCSFWGIYLDEILLLYIPFLLGGLSPTIASYIVLKKNGMVPNFKAWIRATFDFKHGVVSYLLLPIFAGIFFFCLCSISGYESGAPMMALVVMIPMMLLGGGLEEAGWRGILQPELEKKYGYTKATILVAIVWWLWHTPLFFIVGVSQYGADFVAFGIDVIGLSFALSAIKKITTSTFLCVAFHCLINSLHGVYIVGENVMGNFCASAALIIFSYVIIRIQRNLRIFT